MTLVVTHKFVDLQADGPDPTIVRPSNWNDSHAIAGSIDPTQFPALTGDVTTSAGSVATTIAGNAVTNAKAAQMVANTIKGNNTGSTANAADLTVAQAQTMLGTPVLLNTLTASNSASLSDTTSFTAAYSNYFIDIENLLPATNAVVFEVLVHSGGAFQTTGYLNTSTFLDFTFGNPVDNTAGGGISMRLWAGNLSLTTNHKMVLATYGMVSGGSVSGQSNMAMWNGGLGAVDGFQFKFASGNISSGTIRIYGIP